MMGTDSKGHDLAQNSVCFSSQPQWADTATFISLGPAVVFTLLPKWYWDVQEEALQKNARAPLKSVKQAQISPSHNLAIAN